MKTAQLQFISGKWIENDIPSSFPSEKAQLVLVFGS